MNILGLSFGYHDAALSLLQNGEITWALQEERFSRVKNDPRIPKQSFAYLKTQLGDEKIDAVVFYEKSFLKFDRILHDFIQTWPKSYGQFQKAFPLWLGNKLKIKKQIQSLIKDPKTPIYFCRHHESHAASAYFTSGLNESAILTLDGVGEWECGGIHHAVGNKITTLESRHYPHSAGLFYSAFTDFLGFEVNEGEYKVMGLAPYGKPRFVQVLKDNLISIQNNGEIQLNAKFLSFPVSERAFQVESLEKLLGFPRRESHEPMSEQHWDLAASIQIILEELVLKSARHALKITGSKNLCFAGGVALNCVANGKVLQRLRSEGLLNTLHFISACGDAGGSLGAALYYYHHLLGNPPQTNARLAPYWGPAFSDVEIEKSLLAAGVQFRRLTAEEKVPTAIHLLLANKILGWFQGRMEFGPRALGNRSILGDARLKENWVRINRMVKFREDFRPLAPAIVAEKAAEYFELEDESPLMLLVAQNKTTYLPAITHVDQSSRVQTVSKGDNALFHQVLESFGKETGVPVLINTSMNTSGMPIVCAPQDALRCFIESDLDAMIIGSYLLERSENPWLAKTFADA